MAGSIHSAVRMTVLSLFLFGSLLHASTVLLTVDSVNPDPVLIDQPAAVQVSAAFTADGTEQAQLTNQWSVEYRYHWSLSPDGAVSGLSPELDDDDWTVWAASSVGSGSCTFPTTGIKSLLVMCQVRLRKGEEIGDVCAEGSVTTPISCTVDLADAVNFRAVEVGTDWVRLSWDPSPDADVVGYAYHIEPDEETTVDVGNVTETVVSDLEPGVEYEFGLHAYDADGNMTHTVFTCATTEPEPPSNVTAYGEDGSAVIIFKRSPTDSVTDYKLEQSTDSGASWSSCSPATSSDWYPAEPYDYVEAPVSGLTNGTTYRFRVSALPPGSPSPTGENPESGDIIPSPFFDLYLTKAKVNRWRACMKYDDCQPVDWSTRPRSVAEIEELHIVLEGMSDRALTARISYGDYTPAPPTVSLINGIKTETVEYDGTGPWEGVSVPNALSGSSWSTLPGSGNRGLIDDSNIVQLDTALGLLTASYWRNALPEELVAEVQAHRLDDGFDWYSFGMLLDSQVTSSYPDQPGAAKEFPGNCGVKNTGDRVYCVWEPYEENDRLFRWQKRYLTVAWGAFPVDVVDAFFIQTGTITPDSVGDYIITPCGSGIDGPDDDPSAWAIFVTPDHQHGEYHGTDERPSDSNLYKQMAEHSATVTDIRFTDGSGNTLSNGDHGYAIIAVPNDTATIQAWATYTVATTPPCEFTVPLSVEISSGDDLAHLSKPDQFHAIRPGIVTLSATADDIKEGHATSPTTETINVAVPTVELTGPIDVVLGDQFTINISTGVSWNGTANVSVATGTAYSSVMKTETYWDAAGNSQTTPQYKHEFGIRLPSPPTVSIVDGAASFDFTQFTMEPFKIRVTLQELPIENAFEITKEHCWACVKSTYIGLPAGPESDHDWPGYFDNDKPRCALPYGSPSLFNRWIIVRRTITSGDTGVKIRDRGPWFPYGASYPAGNDYYNDYWNDGGWKPLAEFMHGFRRSGDSDPSRSINGAGLDITEKAIVNLGYTFSPTWSATVYWRFMN